ncbi:hypothetical protein ACTXT7_002013 [Hymenolepis weldensis]
MSLSEKWQKFVDSASLSINRATQMGDEAFNNMPKTEYDKETVKALAYADLMNKICNNLKLQLESMFTPNPVRRVAKIFASELNLNVPGDQPPPEKLANIVNECAVEMAGTDFCRICALAKERRKLDLLRLDYDWASNDKRNKDALKVAEAKMALERQIYVTQVLLKQCEVTRDKLANGLLEMAKAQERHYKRCMEIVQRLTAVVSQEEFVN